VSDKRSSKTPASQDRGLEENVASYVSAVIGASQAVDQGNESALRREEKALKREKERLRERGTAGQRALISLLRHPNPWVRLDAAAQCLAFDRDAAEKSLEQVSEDPGLAGLTAATTLKEWRAGRMKRPAWKDLSGGSPER